MNSCTDLLIRITAPHFVAGAVLKSERVVFSAPILGYMQGWTESKVVNYCREIGWSFMLIEETRVVNCRKEEYDIYIGRPSKWGNPFVIGIHGDRKKVIEKYEKWIRFNKKLFNDLHELRGKKLGCFCSPAQCHGDVLVKLLKEVVNDFEKERSTHSQS